MINSKVDKKSNQQMLIFSKYFFNASNVSHAKSKGTNISEILAARRLRIADPDYYFELRRRDLDLLYFLIEPEMSKIIYMTRSGSGNEDEIIFLMNEILQT